MAEGELNEDFWKSLNLIQKDVRSIFELNGVNKEQFLRMDLKDLSDSLGIKYYSDRRSLIDAQKKIKSKALTGAGTGQRTDLHNLQASWDQVEVWRKKKALKENPPFTFQNRTKVFHVSKRSFSRQNNIQAEKGQIPIKVNATPTLASVKLACWNAFNRSNDLELPEDIELSITDNSKTKLISLVMNDSELAKISSIGIFWRVKEESQRSQSKPKQRRRSDLASVNIMREDLQFLEEIGKGQFGRVHKSLWKGMQVAIKEIPLGYGEPDISEVSLCSRLRHPNVIMLLGHVITDDTLLLKTNYVRGTNLAKSLGLARGTKQVLEPKWNGFIMYNVCQGMAYISEKGIIHQDLKPANILVEHQTNKAIICDLGVGRLKDATHQTCAAGNAGTVAYQHKDQLEGKAPTTAADVYSFGVIMVEVYTRKPVWKGFSLAQLQKSIMDDVYPAYESAAVPAGARYIIHQCFQNDAKRPTFVSLLPQVKDLVESDIDIW